MDRRDLLAAGAAGLAGALAGCGSGVEDPSATATTTADTETTATTTPDPAPNLSFDRFELPERESGDLVVVLEVVNDGDEEGSATMEVYVRAGDREFTRRREVALAVGERETFEFTFESVDRAAVFEDGTVDPQWVPERET